jgi:hypothetical protein
MTATDTDAPANESDDAATVTAHESSPERTVFTEKGNSDGWIATDLGVQPER